MKEEKKGGLGLSKTAINHLIENCYFVGNVTMKQTIDIPVGTDQAPFWANSFLHSFGEEYMSSLISSGKIKVEHFYSTKRFIDDLCAINDGREFGIFEFEYNRRG